MTPKQAAQLSIVILAGAFLLLAGISAVLSAQASTIVNSSQVGNVPQLPSQFGFNCTTVEGVVTCEVDRAYMLHLLPVPFDGTAKAPSPGPCADSGGIIVTNEPAAYFCVKTSPGVLNWMRVAGVSTW